MTYRLAGMALAVAIVFAACKSTPDEDTPKNDEVTASLPFKPATYHSSIHHKEGQYLDLYSPESFAVWVGPEVAEVKRAEEEGSGVVVDSTLVSAAAYVTENYVVVECHLVSKFGDTSIAYDAVGLRGIDAYLETPDGNRVAAIQRILGSPAAEEQVEALRKFSKTNVLIFPKTDVVTGHSTVDGAASELRVVLDGAGSSFYFAWPAAQGTLVSEEGGGFPSAKEAADMVRTKFTEFFSKLRVLAENFH